MKKSERLIEGVYRYCDRWCERCKYSPYCAVFHDSQPVGAQAEGLWQVDQVQLTLDSVERAFRRTNRLLVRLGSSTQAQADAPPEPSTSQLDKHPLVRRSVQYMDLCRRTLSAARGNFNQACDHTQEHSGFLETGRVVGHLRLALEAVKVLVYDHTMIHVKTRSACRIHLELPQVVDPDQREAALADLAGTASVAWRCLERSMQALHVLYERDVSLHSQIIDLLLLAKRMKQELLAMSPSCQHYAWPSEQMLQRLGQIQQPK